MLIARLLVIAALAAPIAPPSADAACNSHSCRHRVQAREFADQHGGCRTRSCVRRVDRKHWEHLQRLLPTDTKRMLARLRGCETRGIPYPRNYRYDGRHRGAYQYSWGPGSAGERAGFRVAPNLASPAEQDVRTARFFPSHRGEWACRA